MLRTEANKFDTTARLVLVALAEVGRGKPCRSFPALATLRLYTGLDRRSIQRALGRLSTAGLIKAVGKRQDVTVWQLDLSLKRPDSDLADLEAEVETARLDEQKRWKRRSASRSGTESPESTSVSGTENPGEEGDSGTLHPDSGTQNPHSGTLSTGLRDATPPRTDEEPVNEPVVSEPVPPEAADADAPRGGDEPDVIEAEIVEDDEGLFDSSASSIAAKPKTKRRARKVDLEKDRRQQQAHDLADRYYRSKNRMVKFMAVRGVVVKALENYPYEVVFEGVKRMATQDRNRPFTLDTLREAIERNCGVLPATGRGNDPLAQFAPGDQIQIRTEFLKTRPNWERLSTYGITPANAHLLGYTHQAS
ncbi:MAG TPA: hypothetical protein VGX25_00615 [Actinophytocola sp.]|uniref:hypothetical protein n=1 Tax=Actinophytocola sp. TaxID=1872138 RepID=UPI002DDD27DB|nr:hypothetical protein [Actinophytocola sp.]HEV2777881.1 hypothetical protein [Actinophytocola sp.]